jgi:CspA family cold shock protein
MTAGAGFAITCSSPQREHRKYTMPERAIDRLGSHCGRGLHWDKPTILRKAAAMTGTIDRVMMDKGFGFIKGEDGRDYFMHRSAIVGGATFELLRDDQPVTFDATQGEKGLRAENVRLD